MQKPPRTPPRRRWYHRYALVEHRTHDVVVLSWHAFEFSAAGSLVDLIEDRDATAQTLADVLTAWEIVAVGELC